MFRVCVCLHRRIPLSLVRGISPFSLWSVIPIGYTALSFSINEQKRCAVPSFIAKDAEPANTGCSHLQVFIQQHEFRVIARREVSLAVIDPQASTQQCEEILLAFR